MASTTMTSVAMSMTASPFLSAAPPAAARRSVIVASAARTPAAEELKVTNQEMNGNGKRRDLMFAAAAAALCSVAGMAVAEEPKRGTAEAKKKYAPVCVTMPTAKICRN